MQQDAQERAQRNQVAGRDLGVEEDDPTARLEWQRHSLGVHNAQSKHKLLQQRAARKLSSTSGSGTTVNGATTNSNVDLSSARFSAETPQANSNPSDPMWISVGPADADYEQNGDASAKERDSGRARKILPLPGDANTLYFLTSGGGLWVTNNFLTDPPTWSPLTDNLPTTGGGSVAFGSTPSSPVTSPGGAAIPRIYLGLGDPFDVINVGGAMVKSDDGGQTWTNLVELGAAQSVRDIMVIPTSTDPNADIVLVATDIGLFRSADGGTSYTAIQTSGTEPTFLNKALWNIVQTTTSGSTTTYLVEAQQCTLVPADFCGTAGTIYYSTDQGASWSIIPNSGNGFSGAGRATLAVGAPGDTTVYAIAALTNDSDQKDLFQSTDGGLTWAPLNITTKTPSNPNGNNPNMDILHGQAWYNQLILVDPTDSARKTVYIGGNLSSAKTTDGGTSWTLISDWIYGEINELNGLTTPSPAYAHADFHTATYANLNGSNTLLFGNDGGLYVSTDGGNTWSSNKNTGLETFLLYTLSANTLYPNNVIVGAQDNGTRVRKGNTKTFNQSIGGDGLGNGWTKTNPEFTYGTAAGSSYRRNVLQHIPDRIEDWESVALPGQTGDSTLFATPIEMPSAAADLTGQLVYTYTAKRVFQINNAPTLATPTRTVIGQIGVGSVAPTSGLPAASAGRSFRAHSHGLGVSPIDTNHLAVAMAGGFLAITSNGGTNWSVVNLGPGTGAIVAPSGGRTWVGFNANVMWADNSTLYVTSEAPGVNAIRIAKSADGGATFAAADGSAGSNPLPDGRVNRIIVDPRDSSKSTLYVGSDLGVFKSIDGGANWTPYGNGLPNVRVSDIYMPSDGSFLMAATYGRGVWELPSLSYVSATLTDGSNGVLNAGKTGLLNITLHNGSSNTLSATTATVTSTTPGVSVSNQPVSFPSANANTDTTASVQVSLDGNVITSVQKVDFTIAYSDSSLNLTTAPTVAVSLMANYDEIPNGATTDDIQAVNSAWTVDGSATNPPDTYQWERREISPTEHRWGISNSNAISDQRLVSPLMHVGSGPFTVSYEQRHFFEFSGTTSFFDGMVVEISSDNGGSWNDVGAATLSPSYGGVLAVGGGNTLQGRQAFVGRNTGYPSFVPVTINLGTQYANKDVRLRFRVGTDILGFGTGIEVRNLAVSGTTNSPFTATIPHCELNCATTTTLAASKSPAFYKDVLTLIAYISGVTTGSVDFKDGTNTIATAVPVDVTGRATYSTSSLTASDFGTHHYSAVYAGDGVRFSGSTGTLDVPIQGVPLTASVTATGKVYDQTTTASVATCSLTGVIGGDNVTCTAAGATFSDKNVGAGKTVTATGITLGGTDAGNYVLSNTTATTTADITVRTLNVTANASSANKTYDGTTAATVTFSDDRLSGDVLTLSSTGTFADKNVGTGKAVSVSSIAISGGVDQNNYTLANTTTSTTSDISVRTLNVTANAGSANKTYNGNTGATVTLADDRVTGDVLTLTSTSSFVDKNAGTGKTVNVSNITVTGGADRNNYALANTTTSTTSDISVRTLDVTANAGSANKTYNGNTGATVTLADDRLSGDVLTLSSTASFVDKNAGTGKTVNVGNITIAGGADQNNYALGNTTTTTTSDISVRTLNVTANSGSANKTYNGNTGATVTLADDRVTGDQLNLSSLASFTTRQVGTGKLVNVTGISIIGGADQTNYSLGNTTTSTTSDVTALGISVTVSISNKTYDGLLTASVAGCTPNGLIGGDVVTCSAAAASFNDKNAGNTKTVTASGVVLSGSDSGNYSISGLTPITANIIPAHLTAAADAQTRGYGAGNPGLTATLSGFVNGETFSSSGVSGTASCTTTAASSSPIGSYSITCTAGSLTALNYDFPNFVTGNLTVTKAHLIATADPQSRAYGAANPPLTATVSGFVNGDTSAVVSGGASCSTGAGAVSTVAASPYAITCAQGTLAASNYDFPNFVPGNLAVTKAHLAVTAVDQTRVYGAANPANSFSLSGFQNGENAVTANVAGSPTLSTGATATSPVGNGYTITVVDSGTLTAPNYDFQAANFQNGKLTITAAHLTVTGDSQSRVYGGSNPGLTATVSGFVNGETLATSGVSGAAGCTTSAVGTSTVGPYAITCTQGTLTASNYDFPVANFVNGSLGITQAPLTVTANSKARLYGDPNPVFDGTLTGVTAGDNITASFSTTAGATTGIGNAAITASLSDPAGRLGNYSVTNNSGTLTISKAHLTVTATNQTRLYGASNPANGFSLSGFKNGETSITANVAGSPTLSDASLPTTAVGTYTITVVDSGTLTAPNYDFLAANFVSGQLTITPAHLTVTGDPQTRVYGGSSNPALTGTVSGFQNGETLSTGGVTGAANCTTTAVTNSTVGPYAISCTQGTLAATNYDFPNFVAGSLSITQAQLTVTANPKARLYGDTNPALDGTLTGVMSFDTITASFSTTAVATTPIGNVQITASLNDPGGRLGNYSITNNPGTLTINRAHLTVTAADETRLYGAQNPANGFSLSGFQNGENAVTANVAGSPTIKDATVATDPVGTYPITITDSGSLTAPNYDFQMSNFVSGKLTITQAHLFVTADAQSRLYGGANPSLTGTVSGFVNGETLASSGVSGQASCSANANALSPVKGSPYTITCVPNTLAASNYDFPAGNFITGPLVVTPAHLVVTADNQSKTYDASQFTASSFQSKQFTATVSGFVNGETLASSGVSGGASFGGAATTAVTAGTYTISPAQGTLTASNYDFPAANFLNGTLTISAATSKSTSTATVVAQGSNAEQITFVATVSPQFAGTPTGTVTFLDNGSALPGQSGSSAPVLTNGVASLAITLGQLGAGTHKVTAVYNGDNNFQAASQVGASVTVLSTITTTAGAAIPAQSLAVSNLTGQSVTYNNTSCNVLNSNGVAVANTACHATASDGSSTLTVGANSSANLSVQIGTSNGSSQHSMLRMRDFGSIGFILPAIFFLPFATPAEVRKRFVRRRTLTMIGLLLLVSLLLISSGCGGGGFTNSSGLQPNTGSNASTAPGSYTVLVTGSASGQTVTLGMIPVNVSF